MRNFGRSIFLCLTLFLGTGISTFAFHVEAQSKGKGEYKKARVLSSNAAKIISKVVEALERVDEEGKENPNFIEAKRLLTEMEAKKDTFKSYDRSVMYNYWGYLYFNDENYDKAMRSYELLLNEPEATIPLRTASLYTLAQLYLVKENYSKGIELLLTWMDEVENVTAQSYSLLAQAYYQTGNYQKSLDSMLEAVRLAEEVEAYRPKENWYVLLAACYSELKDLKKITDKVALEKQRDIYEILVNYYPKKLYFLQLGGVYGQMNREADYMITLKAAFEQDLLDREGEYLALAQLLLLNKNPYWAAQVIVNGQNKKVAIRNEKTGKDEIQPVVKDTEKNLKLLADAWRIAQETDKAIPVLEKAAKLSEDGETFILLGNLYLVEDKLDDAVRAINEGIKKGNLKKPSQARLVLGQAFFELENFEEAKKQFRIAARDEDAKVKKTANNWIKYAENEEVRVKNLALRREYIEQNS
ncbi:MAG: tetratricopeptide repeat protein [Gammaproteobacteria bacterium]